MSPIVDGIETNYAGRLAVQRIDANRGEGPAIMKEYQILGHPSFLVLDSQGREQARFLGPQSQATLIEAIDAVLPE